MEIEKQADEILKYINSLDPFSIQYSSIKVYSTDNNFTEFPYIFEKLLTDDLIETSQKDNSNNKFYNITQKGRDLLRFGGLSQVEVERQTNIIQALKTEKIQDQTLILNALIAFGTLTAAGYYIAELYIKAFLSTFDDKTYVFITFFIFCICLSVFLAFRIKRILIKKQAEI